MDPYTLNDIQARILAGEGLSDQDTLQRGLQHLRSTAPNGDLCSLLVEAGRLDPGAARRIRSQAGEELQRTGRLAADPTGQDDRPTQPLRRMGEDGRPLTAAPGSAPNLAAPSGLQPAPGVPPIDPTSSNFATLPMPPPRSGRPSSSIANSHDSAEVPAPPGHRPPSSTALPEPARPAAGTDEAVPGRLAVPKAAGGKDAIIERARRLSAEGKDKVEEPPEIPGYELRRLLGRGGMGMVHVAWSVKLGREVALKTLSQIDKQHRATALKRFEREARTMASFTHPNIVAVLDFGIEAKAPWLVMELIDGVPLKEKIREGGPLEPDEAARITHRVARALDYAHKKDVLHRDVKSANILLRKDDGEALLTDFGLARRTDGAEQTMTGTGQVLGTPTYMSPEQVEGQRDEVTARSDLYSLGVVLYECLTGTLPFQAASFTNLVMEILTADPPPPRGLRPEIPEVLERICLRCLEKNPEERFRDCAELVQVLDQYLKHEVVTMPTAAVAEPPASSRDQAPAPRSSPALVIIAALLAAALAFAVGTRVGAGRDTAARVAAAELARSAVNEAAAEWLRSRQTALRELDAEVVTAVDEAAREALRERVQVELSTLGDDASLRASMGAAFDGAGDEGRDSEADATRRLRSRLVAAGLESAGAERGALAAGHWRNLTRLELAAGDPSSALVAARRSWRVAPHSQASALAALAVASALQERGHRRLAAEVLSRVADSSTGSPSSSLSSEERARAALLRARLDLQDGRFDAARTGLRGVEAPSPLRDELAWLTAVADGLAGRRVMPWPSGFELTPAEDRGRPLFTRTLSDKTTVELRSLDLDAGVISPTTRTWKSPAPIVDQVWLGRGETRRLAVTVVEGGRRRTLFLQLRDGAPVITERLLYRPPMDDTMVPRALGDMDSDGFVDAVYVSNRTRRCLIANGFGGQAPFLCLLTELCGSDIAGATFVDLDGTGRDAVAISVSAWNHFGLGLVTRPKGSSELVQRFQRLGTPGDPRRIPAVEGGKAERLLLATNRRPGENVGLLFGSDLSPELPDSVVIVSGPAEGMRLDRVAEVPFEDSAARGFSSPRFLHGLVKGYRDALYIVADGDPLGARQIHPGPAKATVHPVRLPADGRLVGLRDLDLDGDCEMLRRVGAELVIDGLARRARSVSASPPAATLPGADVVERLLAGGHAAEAAILAEALVREAPSDAADLLQRRLTLLRARVRAELQAGRPAAAARLLAETRMAPSAGDGGQESPLLRTLAGPALARLDREVCELVQDHAGALAAALRERRSRPGPVRARALETRIAHLTELANSESVVDLEALMSGSTPFRLSPLLRARRRDGELVLSADGTSGVALHLPLDSTGVRTLSVDMTIRVHAMDSGGLFGVTLRDKDGAARGLAIGRGVNGDATSHARGWFAWGTNPNELTRSFGADFPRGDLRLRLTWHDDLSIVAAEVWTKSGHGYEVFPCRRPLGEDLALVIGAELRRGQVPGEPIGSATVAIRELKVLAGRRGLRSQTQPGPWLRKRARAATAWLNGRADGLRRAAEEASADEARSSKVRMVYWLAAAELAALSSNAESAISCLKAARSLDARDFERTWRRHFASFAPALRKALAEVLYEGVPLSDLNNRANAMPQGLKTLPDFILMLERVDPTLSASNIPGVAMILLGRYQEGARTLSAFRDPGSRAYRGLGLSRLGRYEEALATWGPAESIPKELRRIIEAARIHAELIVRSRAPAKD